MIAKIALLLVFSHSTPCQVNQVNLERAIYARAKHHSAKYRARMAKRLSRAILRESKRSGIPPLALTAVAEIESSYGYWVRGKVGELGIFQLIQGDYGPRKALRKIPPDVKRWRLGKGNWTKRELQKSIRIQTYVAAYEIKLHVKHCKMRRWGHGSLFKSSHTRSLGNAPRILGRIGHYNSGPRIPRRNYLRKLARAWRGIKREACNRSR